MMRVFFLSSILMIFAGFLIKGSAQVIIGATEADTSTIVQNLDTPWEILWGPDDHIWLTERSGRISRVHPETGELTELITIGEVYEQGESGLLGMVLHPDFNNHPYVFVAYTYFESSEIKERLVRYTYADGSLGSPMTLLEGIDGAGIHNGSRLVIDADQKLYMTTGDAGQTSLSPKPEFSQRQGAAPEPGWQCAG
jgi:glucose/arabinose dehydrogenase